PARPTTVRDSARSSCRHRRTMTYRDELQAARERNETLETELEEARARIRALEQPAPKQAMQQQRSADVRAPARMGRVFFHRPPTFFPLLGLFAAALRATVERAPYAPAREHDRVVMWVLYALVWRPFVYAVRVPVYWASIAIAVPVALAVCLVG